MAAPATSPDTRDRLLHAAGEVFAAQGFRAATVREICRLAEANVAAVNYHFGDKEGLYAAVLTWAHSEALQRHPPYGDTPSDAPPEERLAAFVRSFLARIFEGGRPCWHGQLMAREMVDPTPALDRVIENSVRPQFVGLLEVVRALLGPAAATGDAPGEERVRLAAFSVVGQVLFYHHCRPVLERVAPPVEGDLAGLDRLAAHITETSLAGMRACRARLEAAVGAPSAGAAGRGASAPRRKGPA